MAIEVTNANFESVVIQSTIPVVVDFWASWCSPCKEIAPIIEAVAEKYAGRVLVVKANIDQNDKAVADYGVRSIPLLAFFRDGKDSVLSVGYTTQEKIERLLEPLL